MTPHPSIPAWPEKPAKNDNCARLDLMGALSICNDQINYERARAEAWEARCRVLAEALREIAKNADAEGDGSCEPRYHGHGCYSPELAKNALEAIGELPE